MTPKEEAKAAFDAMMSRWDERVRQYEEQQAERNQPEPSVFQDFLAAAGRLGHGPENRPVYIQDENGRRVRVTRGTFDRKKQ